MVYQALQNEELFNFASVSPVYMIDGCMNISWVFTISLAFYVASMTKLMFCFKVKMSQIRVWHRNSYGYYMQ